MVDRIHGRLRVMIARLALAVASRWPNRVTARVLAWALDRMFRAALDVDPVTTERVARELRTTLERTTRHG